MSAMSAGSAFAFLPASPPLPTPPALQLQQAQHWQLLRRERRATVPGGALGRWQRSPRDAQRAAVRSLLGKLLRQPPPPPPWWQAPLRLLSTLCLAAAAMALLLRSVKRLRKGRGPSAADARLRLEASMGASASKRPQASNSAAQIFTQVPPAAPQAPPSTAPVATPPPAPAPTAAPTSSLPPPAATTAPTPGPAPATTASSEKAAAAVIEGSADLPKKPPPTAPTPAASDSGQVSSPAPEPSAAPATAEPAVAPVQTPVGATKTPALPKARPPPPPKTAAAPAVPAQTTSSPETPAPATPVASGSAGSAVGSTAFPGRKASAVQVDPAAPQAPAAKTAAAAPKAAAPAAPAPVEVPVPQGLKVESTPDRGKVLVSTEAKRPGDIVFREAPVLAVRQAQEAPTLSELQEWLDSLAALQARTRAAVLSLSCPAEAAVGGHLASVLGGPTGSKMSQLLRVPDGVSPEDCWTFLRVMECNTFRVQLPDGAVRVELLLTTSRMNHSCLPNALRGPSPTEELEVEVRALRPISPGEELTISYLPADSLVAPTAERRELLDRRWQFTCECIRCSQPDPLRAFQFPAGPLSKEEPGVVIPTADGNELTACPKSGKRLSAEQLAKAFDAEAQLVEKAPRTERAAQAAAAELQAALEARDGPRFDAASKEAMQQLKECASVALASAEVAGSHYLVTRLAKSAASLRAMLGDGLAAGGKEKLSQDMWSRAAGELNGAVESEAKWFHLPRDGRIADLIGLSGLHQRLGNAQEARRCLLEAHEDMKLIYWACEPGQKASSMEMQIGVERAIEALDKAIAAAADAPASATATAAAEPPAQAGAVAPAVVDVEDAAQ